MSPPNRPPGAVPVPPAAMVVSPAELPFFVSWSTFVCSVPSDRVSKISYVPAASPLVCQLKMYWLPSFRRLVPGVGVGLNGVPRLLSGLTGATWREVRTQAGDNRPVQVGELELDWNGPIEGEGHVLIQRRQEAAEVERHEQ